MLLLWRFFVYLVFQLIVLQYQVSYNEISSRVRLHAIWPLFHLAFLLFFRILYYPQVAYLVANQLLYIQHQKINFLQEEGPQQ